MSTTTIPQPAVGQVWRNTRSHRLVVVVTLLPGEEIHWRALSGRGPKAGVRWYGGWTDTFEYVAASRDDLPTDLAVTER